MAAYAHSDLFEHRRILMDDIPDRIVRVKDDGAREPRLLNRIELFVGNLRRACSLAAATRALWASLPRYQRPVWWGPFALSISTLFSRTKLAISDSISSFDMP